MIYPFYGQATKNNGIISYNQLTKTVLNNEKGKSTILIHSNNQNIVYVETPFYLKDGHGATSILQSDRLNKINQLFIISAIDKVISSKYSYNNKATKIELKNSTINLPIKNDEIDYEFIENFIEEIENEHITKLEVERTKTLNAYLKATDLKDYTLSDEEQKSLSDFDNEKLNWSEFKIDKIFEINNTLSFNKDKLTSGLEYDYITRTSKNQGVLQKTGFVNSENINPSGNWSLGLLQMDFFYRSKPWYAGQFVRKINLNIKVTKNENLYFTIILNKLKEKLLTVLVRDIDKTFLNLKVQLPLLKNNEIDHLKIDCLISAIQKLVIKDVILSTDKKINATKNIITEKFKKNKSILH